MFRKFFIFLIVFLIIFSFLFFDFERTEAQTPLAKMKTKVDGKFYIPNKPEKPQSLKVVFLFNNPDLEGDQSSDTGEPDKRVDFRDVGFINIHFGQNEGDPGWDYMADVVPDKKIDEQDQDLISKNMGKFGNYTTDFSNTIVKFNTGDVCNLDGGQICNIPGGATNFTVEKNGNPIGAYIHFYAEGLPSSSFLHLINPLACTTFSECIEKIISFIFWVAITIFPIVIIIAGFLFITSGGNPEKVRTAKRMIFWAVISMVLILFARGSIYLIKKVIG